MGFWDFQLAKKSEKQGFLIGVLQCHFYRKDTVIKIWGVVTAYFLSSLFNCHRRIQTGVWKYFYCCGEEYIICFLSQCHCHIKKMRLGDSGVFGVFWEDVKTGSKSQPLTMLLVPMPNSNIPLIDTGMCLA